MKKMDRQEFIQQACKRVIGKALSIFDGSAFRDASAKESTKTRPPGAWSDDNKFLSLCTGCDACMAACPVNVILIDDLNRRDPFISGDAPCIHCPGYPCIASCPSGALDYDNPRERYFNAKAQRIKDAEKKKKNNL